MAKVNPKVKQMAAAGGMKPPPMAPGFSGNPEQLKKQAKAKAMARLKMFLKVLVFIAIIALVAGIVYFVKFHGRQPKDAFNRALSYAYKDDKESFRGMFTEDSIALLEQRSEGLDPWEHLMLGITPSPKPKVLNEKVYQRNSMDVAELSILIEGQSQTVHMRKEEGSWKINLNIAINPTRIVLPSDIPPEYVENFKLQDENEAWWEEDETKEAKKEQESEGAVMRFFRRLMPGAARR